MIQFSFAEFKDWLAQQPNGGVIMSALTLAQLHQLHGSFVDFARVMEDDYDRINAQTAAARAALLAEASPLVDSPARRRYEMIRDRRTS